MQSIDNLLKDLENCQLKSEDDALGFANYRLLKNDIKAALMMAYEQGRLDERKAQEDLPLSGAI